ncbi:MAG: potassium/proton antiporter [Ruminococcus sp.]|nr:potassium/proton antiporter [Ruminococcus sp.]
MIQLLLLLSVSTIACILCNKITAKIGIPMLLAFLCVGMLCGEDGILGISFNDYQLTENVCTAALILIIFYGGFGTKWSAAKPVAGRAILLSTVGVFLTAVAVGGFCHIVLHVRLLESLLIGSVISSTDAASVFSILRAKKLNLKYGTASLLEVESGSNDPIAYLMVTIVVAMMETSVSAGSVLYQVFAQIVFGVGIGAVLALVVLFFLRRFRFDTSGFDLVFMLAVAILSYVVPTMIGGNGYLSAYIAGIILGNAELSNKKNLVHFFDGVTGLMQLLVFFILGMLCTPTKLIGVLLPALGIAIFLTFLARPLVVGILLTPFRAKFSQQLLISWAGLRGATSAIFAITAVAGIEAAGSVTLKYDLFHLVFCIVLFSIALQGTFLPWVSKKLHMIDDSQNVLKTFTDYTDEEIIQTLQLPIHANHAWIDQPVSSIALPPDTLLAMLIRNGKTVIPKGNTKIEQGDVVVLSAGNCQQTANMQLSELVIDDHHKWNGKQIRNLNLGKKTLILMIQRGSETIIPQGDTEILAGDTVVLHSETT